MSCFRQSCEQCQRNECLPLSLISILITDKEVSLSGSMQLLRCFSQSRVYRMIVRLCSLSASWLIIVITQFGLFGSSLRLVSSGPGPVRPVGWDGPDDNKIVSVLQHVNCEMALFVIQKRKRQIETATKKRKKKQKKHWTFRPIAARDIRTPPNLAWW